MTERLDPQSRESLITYRLNRAKETLKEADYNAAGGYFNTAVNRLYYACYYAATALMLSQNLEAGTHKGVKTMLGLHFIQKGILEPRFANIYQQLFTNRHAGDYEDFVYNDVETYNHLKNLATEFVDQLIKLIRPPK